MIEQSNIINLLGATKCVIYILSICVLVHVTNSNLVYKLHSNIEFIFYEIMLNK